MTKAFRENCPSCGAMPGDQCDNPWDKLPWIVTLKDSGRWRFIIDERSQDDPDMFSGFHISLAGKIGAEKSLTTGGGGRFNFHRSHFIEELPS